MLKTIKMLLCNLVKTLRVGGVLMISVPHVKSLLEKIEDAMVHIPSFGQGPNRKDLQYSKRRYNIKNFLDDLQNLSLELREHTFFGTPLLGKRCI